MKKLLYFLTMFLNITGIILCISLIFTLKNISLTYLPLIFLSIAIFTFSFGITFLDYNKKNYGTKNKYEIQKPQITDYKTFFSQRKKEFLI
jgi:hypothetical protein